jgi:hypothetical protein
MVLPIPLMFGLELLVRVHPLVIDGLSAWHIRRNCHDVPVGF